jgi:hypothetical protein
MPGARLTGGAAERLPVRDGTQNPIPGAAAGRHERPDAASAEEIRQFDDLIPSAREHERSRSIDRHGRCRREENRVRSGKRSVNVRGHDAILPDPPDHRYAI